MSFFVWQEWRDLNPRMTESKSVALPLGYTPVSYRYIIASLDVFVKQSERKMPILKKSFFYDILHQMARREEGYEQYAKRNHYDDK